MLEDDLKFNINVDGKEIECNIISMSKIDDHSFGVLFTDNEIDENGNIIIKYGKMISNDDEFDLVADLNESELENIKGLFAKDLNNLINKYIEGMNNNDGSF